MGTDDKVHVSGCHTVQDLLTVFAGDRSRQQRESDRRGAAISRDGFRVQERCLGIVTAAGDLKELEIGHGPDTRQ